MGRHSSPDTTPYEIFNYGIYDGYPALQLAVMAEHRAAMAEEGNWEQVLFAQQYTADAHTVIDGLREQLQKEAANPAIRDRVENLLSSVMAQTVSGRHAYNPASRWQWHPQVTAKRSHETWVDWLAYEAPPAYLFDCLQAVAESRLPRHLQLKKQPPPWSCFF